MRNFAEKTRPGSIQRFGHVHRLITSLISLREKSPVVERRAVAYGKSNCRTVRFGDFCRSFLPERTFAARRSVSGIQQGEIKIGAVIPGDMILKRKRIWSQVAAALRSPFRQKGPTSARTFHRHGLMRVLKMVVDVRFPRRADALPLACCVFMHFICSALRRAADFWLPSKTGG